tara:strand:- start:1125 stop:2219 length:1095 start_codon:yes stop_codon:yes gene_type:complete
MTKLERKFSLLKKKLNIFKANNILILFRPWASLIICLSLLFIIGAFGYRITEGWDWGDSLWMVLITISTIGYGEIEPLSAPGRIVTLLIIAGGLIVVQLTIKRLLDLAESGYFRKMRELRFQRNLRRMENHVILCGYGRIGQEIAGQLKYEGVNTIVVEKNEAQKIKAESDGMKSILADATLNETLILAGIKSCRSLVVTLPNNAANLYVVLSAIALNPRCRVIARAENKEASNKLKLAGAAVVVSPYIAAGRTMAATALRPIAIDFVDLLAGSNCEIEEFKLSDDPNLFSALGENSLADLQLGAKSGAMILAIRDGTNLITNPSRDVKLAPGQLLIALGNKTELKQLREILGETLLKVEKLNC